MGRHLREALPAEIHETRARLDAWRKTRKRGMPYPAEIWSEAMEWARRFGINPVSKALGLSFTDLRKRMEKGHEIRQVPKALEPTFVELSLDPGAGLRGPGESAEFCPGFTEGPIVEVARPDGARLVMRWPAGASMDAGSLVASFLGRP